MKEIKDLVRSILQQSWSSTISGIDLDKAVQNITAFVLEERLKASHSMKKLVEKDMNTYEMYLDSIELDLHDSTTLLIEVKAIVSILTQVHSNNPNKLKQLNVFLERINTQIVRNEQ